MTTARRDCEGLSKLIYRSEGIKLKPYPAITREEA